MHPRLKAALEQAAHHLPRNGVLVLVAIALPVALYLGAAAVAPEGFQPLRPLEKPGAAAVGAQGGPGDTVVEPREVVMPEIVKAIYITSATVGSRQRFAELSDLVDRTELNAMVVDVKNWRGELAFAPESESLKPHAAPRSEIGDLKTFTAPLREKGIYLIARIFVFQDPALAESRTDLAVKWPDGRLWRDNKGIPWLDPAAKDVWKYNVEVAKAAFDGGFDEVQFDYIRFPSDGKTSGIQYPFWDGTTPKHDVMRQFFIYLDRELRVKSGIPTSVDLFGFTMVYHDYDLNIGQLLRDALPYFDAISPMVYPSHYPPNYLGFANPAEHPYEVVKTNMDKGQELVASMRAAEEDKLVENPDYEPRRFATFRPWLQDFDLGADYDVDKIRGQMRATEEGGGSGWIFWNARNVYNEPAYANN